MWIPRKFSKEQIAVFELKSTSDNKLLVPQIYGLLTDVIFLKLASFSTSYISPRSQEYAMKFLYDEDQTSKNRF